jgi:hypothetical protein
MYRLGDLRFEDGEVHDDGGSFEGEPDDLCPWCGTSLGVDARNVTAYEAALEEHVLDCTPWRQEHSEMIGEEE